MSRRARRGPRRASPTGGRFRAATPRGRPAPAAAMPGTDRREPAALRRRRAARESTKPSPTPRPPVVATPEPKSRGAGRLPWIVAGLLAIALAATLARSLFCAEPPVVTTRVKVELAPGEPLSSPVWRQRRVLAGRPHHRPCDRARRQHPSQRSTARRPRHHAPGHQRRPRAFSLRTGAGSVSLSPHWPAEGRGRRGSADHSSATSGRTLDAVPRGAETSSSSPAGGTPGSRGWPPPVAGPSRSPGSIAPTTSGPIAGRRSSRAARRSSSWLNARAGITTTRISRQCPSRTAGAACSCVAARFPGIRPGPPALRPRWRALRARLQPRYASRCRARDPGGRGVARLDGRPGER